MAMPDTLKRIGAIILGGKNGKKGRLNMAGFSLERAQSVDNRADYPVAYTLLDRRL